MTYKSILSRNKPTQRDLDYYYNQQIKNIEYQTRVYYERIKTNRIEKEKERIEKTIQRKINSKLKNEYIKYRSAIKSLKTGNIVIKTKPKSVAQLRTKAYAQFQYYIRLYHSDKSGFVILLDNNKRVHYTQCNGGHYYSKHNHPNLGLEVLNCYPISAMANKLQGDQPGYYWKDNLIKKIGQEKFDELEHLSKQSDLILRDRKYWEEMYTIRSEKLEKLIEERKEKGWEV